MSRKREKRMKKLSKTHIWPSVLFLVLSVIMSFASFGLLMGVSMGDITAERIGSACDNAAVLGSQFESAAGSEGPLLKLIESSSSDTESMFVLDKDGNIIAGFGEPTYSDRTTAPNSSLSGFYSDEGDEYVIRADSEFLNNIIDENGNIDPARVSINLNAMTDNGNPNAMLYEACYWVEHGLSDGRTVMVKCNVPLYRKDIVKSLALGIVVCALMFIPTIFFFINILINVRNQHRMRTLIYTDTTTAGSSYICFEHNADKALRSRKGSQYMIADVTVVKYRNFCNYHGVRAGEELLENVDRRICTYLGKNEVCAHSGKSSFALLMKCPDRESGKERVEAMVNALTRDFSHGGIVFHAGIYFTDNETSPDGKQLPSKRFFDPADCFDRASAARSLLTDDNMPAVAVYDDKLLEEQIWEHHVEERMHLALENEEFQVYIQPKYNPVNNELAGAEALVRWINEEDGFVPPGKFIPIFEKNGFITKLDDYMLSHVAQLQADWLAQGKKIVPVSVNVSRAHFADPDLANHICGIIDKYNVPHRYIEIELTESAFFDDKAALLKTVHDLNALEFEISMDDFGAGYSSLNSLKDLPLDVLKLDAEFFRGENETDRGEIVVSQAIALAKKLNMRIVAEGVEKKEQVDFLAKQGCDMIQGYYFAKPMPAEEYALGLGKPALGNSEPAAKIEVSLKKEEKTEA